MTNDQPFAYMLLDLHPASRDNQRILSRVLKDEGFMHCYQFCLRTSFLQKYKQTCIEEEGEDNNGADQATDLL